MKKEPGKAVSRRKFLKTAGLASAALALGGCDLGKKLLPGDVLEEFIQSHFSEMSPDEIKEVKDRLQRQYKKKYGREFVLDACVQENNQSRRPQIEWIRVLRFKKGTMNLEESEHYYEAGMVAKEGYYTVPIQCQQCENPPCVKVCPTKATWKEPDGIVVVDYNWCIGNWCIGCRYCMAACPYWARRFNFAEPEIPTDELNPNLHYLGNRPRGRGVVEKCTFCVQRTRKGRYPACVEVCPVGARKFGNILDPESEISQVLENQRVFKLKEDLNTQPKFYYFFSI
jgi:molybdopterin-containing oxidoreductase family iron-sulfur binding subunit